VVVVRGGNEEMREAERTETRPQAQARRKVMNGDSLVETRDLTKRYGPRILAVDRVSLTLRRGEVYGFLGPNGAGKTTTLRMLLGLIRPTSGTASVLGCQPGDPESLARVGALVESPAFYPYLSGRDNLRVIARYAGVSKERVEAVLELVELTDRAHDKFAMYSLGMKQRLGVAAAVLKDPELLILDEPTNGLDPAGMADMRDLIRSLGSGERTVLLSSHLLGEVEQICDRVGVISGGSLIAEGTVEELRGGAALLVAAKPLDRARERVEQLLGAERVEVLDGTLRLDTNPATAGRINYELVKADVEVTELRRIERTLEEAFLEMTNQKGKSNVG
jgi:ABC-type multidrug transport system ATPase subunit